MSPHENVADFGEKLIKNGRIYFNPKILPMREKGSVSLLTETILLHNQNVAQNETTQSNIRQLVASLQHVCKHSLGTSSIQLFGSSVNGFGTVASDVDCYVECTRDGSDNHLCKLLKSLRNSRHFDVVDYARNARVPVITALHLATKLECDISFSTPSLKRKDVLVNSKLLGKYAAMDVRIPRVCRFIKYLIKSSGFGSARSGGLSSYSHTIMLIYFLTHCKDPLIPVLDVGQESDIPQTLPIQNYSEGDILLDFLKFYSCEFDSSNNSVDINTSATVRRKEKSGNTVRGKLNISDPVIERDLGRSMNGTNTYELKRFYYLIYHHLATHKMQVTELLHWASDPYMDHSIEPAVHPHCNPEYVARKKKRSQREVEPMVSPVKHVELQAPVETDSPKITQLLGELALEGNRKDSVRSIPEDAEIQRLLGLIDDTTYQTQCFLVVATASLTPLVKNIVELCITSFSDKNIIVLESTELLTNGSGSAESGHVIVGTCQQLLKLSKVVQYPLLHTVLMYSPHDVMGQGEVFREMLTAIGPKELKVECLLAYPLDEYLDLEELSSQLQPNWCMKYKNSLRVEEIVELFPPEQTSLRNWLPDLIEVYTFGEKTEEDHPTEEGTVGEEEFCQREKEIDELCSSSSCSSCVQQLDILLKKEEKELEKTVNEEKPIPGVGKFEDFYFEPEVSALRDLREVMQNMNTVREEDEGRVEEETRSSPTTLSVDREEEKGCEKKRHLIHMSEASTRRDKYAYRKAPIKQGNFSHFYNNECGSQPLYHPNHRSFPINYQNNINDRSFSRNSYQPDQSFESYSRNSYQPDQSFESYSRNVPVPNQGPAMGYQENCHGYQPNYNLSNSYPYYPQPSGPSFVTRGEMKQSRRGRSGEQYYSNNWRS